MNAANTFEGYIRALIYPVQFDANPVEQVDRMMQQIEAGRILRTNADDLLVAIQAALQSETELASLIPQPHPEAVIRTYLKELARRLSSASI